MYDDAINNFDVLTIEEQNKIKDYIFTLTNTENWLDKRISNSFNNHKWLNNYFTKDDLKQEFYVNIYKPTTLKNLMKKTNVDRLKYMNSVFSNVLLGMVQDVYGRSTYPLTENLEISVNNVSSIEESVNLTEIIFDEGLERNVFNLLKNGLTNKDIMKQLDISRRSYEKIKNDIKEKIRKERESD